MHICKGRLVDGSKCGKNVNGDHLCLAHKLKKLPRELVTLIFSKIDSLEELYHYTRIYSEAIPAYLERRLEVGKSIANEMLHLNGFSPITTNDRQLIDLTVWRMLFFTVKGRVAENAMSHPQLDLRKIYYAQTMLFKKALNYCVLQFKRGDTTGLRKFFKEPWVRESLINVNWGFDVRLIIYRYVCTTPNFNIYNQMASLANLLEAAYGVLNFLSSGAKIQRLYALISEISEITVDGKRLFHLPAVQKILDV
jgi:hypothetical protein